MLSLPSQLFANNPALHFARPDALLCRYAYLTSSQACLCIVDEDFENMNIEICRDDEHACRLV